MNLTPALGKFAPDFAAAFEMARHQHQKQIGKLLPQPQKLLRQNGFLAGVRAAGHEQRRVRRHAQLRAAWPAHPAVRRSSSLRGVKFQAAHDVDRFRAAAQFAQLGGVRLVLRADAGERREQGFGTETQTVCSADTNGRTAGR